MKNVAAAIIIENDQILLTRRAPGEKLAGFWEFPGGKQESNETIYECLERELHEELTVTSEVTHIFTEQVYHYSGGSINLIAIYANITNGEITLSVHDQYEWVTISQLLDYKLAPADIPIAKKIIHEQC